MLYLQDGSDYVTRARAAHIADQLIAEGRVAPFIIVFVDPVNRYKEYWANDRFAQFMATELVPSIDGRYRTRAERDARALMARASAAQSLCGRRSGTRRCFCARGGSIAAFRIDDERVVTALARFGRDGATARPLQVLLRRGTPGADLESAPARARDARGQRLPRHLSRVCRRAQLDGVEGQPVGSPHRALGAGDEAGPGIKHEDTKGTKKIKDFFVPFVSWW